MMNQNHQMAALQRSLSEQNMPKIAGYLNGRFHETLSENNILKDFKCQKLAKNLFPSQVRKIECRIKIILDSSKKFENLGLFLARLKII